MGSRDKPLVSVLMAAHNEERYVGEAIQSVLRQTLPDFELIVIDDGSTDGTSACLRAFRDPRIRPLRNVSSLGLTRSLIIGMREARSELIARLDADDLAMPRRLEKQVATFHNAPDIGVVGSNCWLIDAKGNRTGARQMPPTDLAIRWRSMLDNPFIHPAVMFRANVYEQAGGYDPSVETAQDYDLWVRMLSITQARNFPQRLIAYRIRPSSITDGRRQQQLANHDQVSWRTLTEVLPGHDLPFKRHRLLRALYAGGPPPVPRETIPLLVKAYWSLLEAFQTRYAGLPGWGQLLRYEWMRNAYRLQRAPWGKDTRAAWRMICAPQILFMRKNA
jgi:glycosyltransferase involved in cell wall biosynthesis